MQAGNPTGFSMQQRSGDQNQLDSQAQQQMIAMLLKNATAAPQRPELSWTQGAARMLEAGVSAYKQNQLNQKNQQIQQQQANDSKILGVALASGDLRQVAAAMQQMKNPQSQSMALNAIAGMQGAKQNNKNEIDKEDRQHQNRMDEETHKNDIDPLKAAQGRINKTNDLIARTQDKMNTEQDPAKKAAFQDTLGALQKKLKDDQTILLGTRGHQYSEQQASLNQSYDNMRQGTKPQELPIDQQQAQKSSGFNPLAAQTEYQRESSKLAAGRENKTLEDLNAQKHAMASMQTKNDQILQMIEAHPNLRGGKGAETMSELQTALHQYLPGMISGNEPQQLYNKLLKQGLVDASGIMRGEAGGGFRLTQNELLYVVAKTVPELSTNSAQGVKDIIEVQNVMNEPIRKHNEAAQQIITSQNLDASQKQEALAKLDRAVIQEMQTNTMHWVNSKLEPLGQKIEINQNFDPIKNPINKYQRVQLDENGKTAGVVDNYNNASVETPKDIQAPQTQGMPPPMSKGSEAPQPQMAQQPSPPQPQQAQSLPSNASQVQASAPTQQSPTSANATPPAPDMSQQSNSGAQPASPQSASYQQPSDPSQSMLAPQNSQPNMPPPPMDQQQMLALALAKKQQDQQLPDYSSQFANSPDMQF